MQPSSNRSHRQSNAYRTGAPLPLRTRRRNELLLVGVIAIGALFVSTPAAHANFVTYSDFSSWNAAVSGFSTATIPGHDGVAIGIGPQGAVYDGVHFNTNGAIADGILFARIGSALSGQSIGILSSQSTNQGGTNMTIAFPDGLDVHGLAFQFGTHAQGPVTFTLSNGHSVTLPSSTINGLYALPDFIGITDTTAFRSLVITTTDSVLNIGDVNYSADPSRVPEPSSIVMLSSLALTAFGIVRVRNRRCQTTYRPQVG